jgi:hypothetical protein
MNVLRRNYAGDMIRSRARWLMHLERKGPSSWPADQYPQPCEDCLALEWTQVTKIRSTSAGRSLPSIYVLTSKGREALMAHRAESGRRFPSRD